MIEIKKKFKAICSNPKYIRQLSWLLEDEYHHHGLHKSTEQEAISIILKMLPPNFKMKFIQGYQDKKTLYDRIPIKGKLNVDTTTYSKKIPLFQRITIYSCHRWAYILTIYIYIQQYRQYYKEVFTRSGSENVSLREVQMGFEYFWEYLAEIELVYLNENKFI